MVPSFKHYNRLIAGNGQKRGNFDNTVRHPGLDPESIATMEIDSRSALRVSGIQCWNNEGSEHSTAGATLDA